VQRPSEVAIAPHRVFSAAQAARIVGVDERSVLARAKRWAAHGRPVCWARGSLGNPMGCALVDAEWVWNYATDGRGVLDSAEPSVVYLPTLPGVSTATPGGELAARLAQAEQFADSRGREANQELIARLESEAETARAESARFAQELATARAEAAHWRRAIGSVPVTGG